MYDPNADPTDRRTNRSLSWTNVLLTYALAAAIPVLLWAVSSPGAAVLTVTVVAAASFAVRYTRRLARCVDKCRGVSFTVPRTARVSVCWAESCQRA
jgi:hypothetical protein